MLGLHPAYSLTSQWLSRKTDKRALRKIAETGPGSTPVVASLIITQPAPVALPSSGSSKSTLSITDGSSVHKSEISAETSNEKAVLQSSIGDDRGAEKGYAWDGYLEDPLPAKTQRKWTRNIRHQVFSLYRRLFGVIFVVNVSILIARLAQGGLSSPEIGMIAIANIFCAILMRQDHVVNAFFTVFCAVPPS